MKEATEIVSFRRTRRRRTPKISSPSSVTVTDTGNTDNVLSLSQITPVITVINSPQPERLNRAKQYEVETDAK